MKWIFNSKYKPIHFDIAVLILRIAIGFFMLKHGIPKFEKFFAEGPIKFSDPLGVGTIPSLLLTVFAEVVCSVLIILGLATRLATIPLIITMAVAVFMVHTNEMFTQGEDAFLYLIFYIILIFLGPGRFSVDRLIK